MTASFSAALMGSPPVILFAPSGAIGAMVVAAMFSVMVSTADILGWRSEGEFEAAGGLVELRKGEVENAFEEMT